MPVRKHVLTMRHDDWIGLAADALRREGPMALTIDNLCARARRTKGSFYHHFKTIGALREAVVQAWIETDAEAMARIAGSGITAKARLDAILRLTEATDSKLELGIRALAATDSAVDELVRKADDRRELVMTTLLAAAYRIRGADAHNLARTFHALHIAALVRAPADPAAFAKGPAETLMRLMEVAGG